MTDDAAKFTLTFEDRDGYLYAYIEGEEDTYEISSAYWRQIAERVMQTGIERVLIDENIRQSGSIADVFRLASEIPKMGFGQACVAFFDRYLDQHDVNAFGELVAVNRGFHGRVFNDIDEATKWLLCERSSS